MGHSLATKQRGWQWMHFVGSIIAFISNSRVRVTLSILLAANCLKIGNLEAFCLKFCQQLLEVTVAFAALEHGVAAGGTEQLFVKQLL